jgi:hypothetical protein
MFDVSRYVLVVLALVGSAVTLASVAAGSDTHASGRLCGVNACADLPSTIAVEMAQRGDSFSPASKPRPRPYYKVRVTSDGTEGYISLYVVWVPSKHVFRMKEYVTPPLAAYWRTGNKDYESQFAQLVQAGKLKPFPASRRYK